jgi:hypothetical protein
VDFMRLIREYLSLPPLTRALRETAGHIRTDLCFIMSCA